MKKAYIYFTGGLGNQLFQYSAARALAEDHIPHSILQIGRPRTDDAGRPEIMNILPSISNATNPRFEHSKLLQRILAFNLRLSVKVDSSYSMRLMGIFAVILSSLICSFLIQERIFVIISNSFCPRIFKNKSLIFVGYFQNLDVAEKAKPELLEYRRKAIDSHEILAEFRDLVEIERPVIIHVRRGDYENNENFGLIEAEYYLRSLDTILQRENESRIIWVFSDDVGKARILLRGIRSRNIRWLGSVQDSTTKTILAMSLGCDFIIANSTFSWWAAFLGTDAKSVFYPKNWLRQIPHSPRLFPPDWTGFEAKYDF